MKIIKRNGAEVPFDITKIITAVTKASDSVGGQARLSREQITPVSYTHLYRFNWRTAKPLGPNTAPGCDEQASGCQTSPSMWTLGGDQPVIRRVTSIR